MSDMGFDYGGELAETTGGFKQATVGVRNARLYGLLRLGTYREVFRQGGKEEVKAPAPQAIAIFHMLGKDDVLDDGSPMFFTKPFPMKKGDKSFLHKTFIPAFGGMSKHKGFGTMINCLTSLKLKGKGEKEDGTPQYINFDSISEIGEDMLEMIEAAPKFAALENPVGFLREDQLTREALEMLHPTREFAGILMKTEEFVAGTHPCQELIQGMFDENPERYTPKAKTSKDDDEEKGGDTSAQPNKPNEAGKLPTEQEDLSEEQEF